MSSFWQAIPFIGALLSLSLLPIVAPALWHRFENYFLTFWGTLSVLAITYSSGPAKAASMDTTHILFHTLWNDYIPFVALIFALFTITGGVHIDLKSRVTPFKNVFMLCTASFIASFVGTTGASILFIRPILKMNKSRIYITHTVVFFIFSVSNIAGCLTPLGDPPLFLGYLMDVPFFWPLINLWQPFLFVFIALMVIYGCIDFYLFKKEKFVHMNSDSSFEINFSSNTTSVALLKPVIQGKRNILLLVFIIALVIITPNLPVVEFMHVFSVHITLTDCLRIFLLFGLGLLSYFITPHSIHQKQNFNFHPISEIARVFLCIFITLAPVSEMLSAGKEGPFAPLLAIIAASDPERYYFWLTGLFSSFLDNAPTYVVFFELAGGNTIDLTTTHSSILVAISLGAVFMGALTYIGNAPNFMVRSIAKQHGVHMPSFFGYMAWSFLILIPIFLIMSFIWL